MKTGIVGLPNVGKSTLFNALTGSAMAQAANYPFCTIEPNSGEVAVPDPRLDQIASICGSERTIPARTTFVDIAGLVKGASTGQGLGNRFLASIREVDAIAHVVRCFVDPDVTHVSGQINPIEDIETIETELMLADLDSAERQREKLSRRLKSGDLEAQEIDQLLTECLKVLENGEMASAVTEPTFSIQRWRQIGMLTAKPVLYICNVDDSAVAEGNDFVRQVEEYAKNKNCPVVVCSAAFEEQLIGLDTEEIVEFLASVGSTASGLQRLITVAYELLGLQTFFTGGPNESRAWTIPKHCTAIDAADRIHRDFSRGFIRAETVSFDDFVQWGGEAGAKEAGKLRSEGRDYLVQDGDVLRFLFNV